MLTQARSGLTMFHYDLLGPEGPLGVLEMPSGVPQPTKPGTRPAEGTYVRVSLPGQDLRIEFEVAREGWLRNDLRFRLVRDLETLATASRAPRGRDWEVSVGEGAWLLRNRSNLLRVRFELLHGGEPAGEIAETRLLSLVRRDFRLELPDGLAEGPRAFLFFLAVNQSFR